MQVLIAVNCRYLTAEQIMCAEHLTAQEQLAALQDKATALQEDLHRLDEFMRGLSATLGQDPTP